jgi:hypothetical protein
MYTTPSCTCGQIRDTTLPKNTSSRDKTTGTAFDPVFVPALISTAIGIGLLEYERSRKKHGDNDDHAWEQFKNNILNPYKWDPFNLNSVPREAPRTDRHSRSGNGNMNISAYSTNPRGHEVLRSDYPTHSSRTHARTNREQNSDSCHVNPPSAQSMYSQNPRGHNT